MFYDPASTQANTAQDSPVAEAAPMEVTLASDSDISDTLLVTDGMQSRRVGDLASYISSIPMASPASPVPSPMPMTDMTQTTFDTLRLASSAGFDPLESGHELRLPAVSPTDLSQPSQLVAPSVSVPNFGQEANPSAKFRKRRVDNQPITKNVPHLKKSKHADSHRAFDELVRGRHIYDLCSDQDKSRLEHASGITLCDLDDKNERNFFIMAVPMLGFTTMQSADATQQERVEFGLFSKKHFKKDDNAIPYIGLFRGPYQTEQEATDARSATAYRTIEFDSNGLYWLCESEVLSGAASYSNQLELPNTRLVLDKQTGLPHLIATRDILPYDQITWTYGLEDKKVQGDFETLETNECSASKILEIGIPHNDPRLSLLTPMRTRKDPQFATIDTTNLKEIVSALEPNQLRRCSLPQSEVTTASESLQPEIKQDFNFSCPTPHNFKIDQILHQLTLLEQGASKDHSVEIDTALLIAIARQLTPDVIDKWYTDPDQAIHDLANRYAEAARTRFLMINTFIQYNGKSSVTPVIDSRSHDLGKFSGKSSSFRFFNPKTVVIKVESLKLLHTLFTSKKLTPKVKFTKTAVVGEKPSNISFLF